MPDKLPTNPLLSANRLQDELREGALFYLLFGRNGAGKTDIAHAIVDNLGEAKAYLDKPENGLHPTSQAKLMESLWHKGRKSREPILIETHSEHMLEMLLNLMEVEEDTDKLVVIYYVWRDREDITRIRRVETKNGQLLDPINTDFSDNPTLSII